MYSYPTPGTKRGLHGSASCYHNYSHDYVIRWLKQMGIGWFKVLDDCNGSSIEICRALVRNDIFPIVRLYRPRPNAKNTVLSDDAIKTVKALVNVGVKYFEPNNEPNLSVEWNDSDWNKPFQEKTKLVVTNWLIDAEEILARGGLPGFPALAQCGHTQHVGSIMWYNQMILCDLANQVSRAKSIFNGGAWVAVHDAPLNHFYKADNNTWRFDYPYDPICQKSQPNKTIFQDDNSAIGHRVPLELLRRIGIETVAISTEGGIFVPRGGSQVWDNRYPPVTYQTHAEGTVALFQFYETEPNFLGMCPWLLGNEWLGHYDKAWSEDAWVRPDGTFLPVVNAMMATRAITDDEVRNAAWNKLGIPYNPDAAFPKFARQSKLGQPVTSEFDIGNMRVQGYTGGILTCPIGQWDRIRIIEW